MKKKILTGVFGEVTLNIDLSGLYISNDKYIYIYLNKFMIIKYITDVIPSSGLKKRTICLNCFLTTINFLFYHSVNLT